MAELGKGLTAIYFYYTKHSECLKSLSESDLTNLRILGEIIEKNLEQRQWAVAQIYEQVIVKWAAPKTTSKRRVGVRSISYFYVNIAEEFHRRIKKDFLLD